MKKVLTAVALSIAIPSIVHAQTAPPSKGAEKEKCACCKDMMQKGKEGHDMSGMDAHAGHDMNPPAPKSQTNK